MPIICRRWVLGLLSMSLVACHWSKTPNGVGKPTASKSGSPASGANKGTPSGDRSAAPTGPAASASPAPALVSDLSAVPLSAHIVRDLRLVPLDFAYSAAGTWWLLDPRGLWQRTATNSWLKVTDFTGTDVAQPADSPVPELVVDGQDKPWLLDRKLGHLWRLGAEGKWESAGSGLQGAKGLSVAADGTAYALATGTTSYYRMRAGNVEIVPGKPWKAPETTGIAGDGKLFVVDPGSSSVIKPDTGQTFAPVPSEMGAISIGRDADGGPLIVGGTHAPVAIKLGDKGLIFPKLPSAAIPTSGDLTGMRLFIKEAGRIVLMTRHGTGNDTGGELREGYAPERKPGPAAISSQSYTGKPLQLRSLIERKATELASGYKLYRISGRSMDDKALNSQSAWLYEFVGPAGSPLLALSLGPQGLVIEQVYLPGQPPGLTPLGELPFDADQARAYAIKAGMAVNVRFDVALEMLNGKPCWRLNWVSGGQTYRVDAGTGNAVLEGSVATR